MAEYRVRRGDTLSKIAANHDLKLNQLLAMNPTYKSDPDRLAAGDLLLVPDKKGRPIRPEVAPMPSPSPEPQPAAVERDWFSVPRGQLTFDAEGMEKPGSPWHSRVPHVPGRWSGVTIGRGYDMSQRSREGISTDLLQAEVPASIANRLAGCSGYKGQRAKDYLDEQNLHDLSITSEQQFHLFLDTYAELAGDVLRICTKADVVAKYGATDWDNLDPILRDIVIDLRYRGDYTPASRNLVQPILVANSRRRMESLMANEEYWRDRFNVPRDRFERRRKYISVN
jgi:hypothetical protein